MDPLHKLEKIFAEFPGIGPRQAKRFVYFLLTRTPSYISDLTRSITTLKEDARVCTSCFRFFQLKNEKSTETRLCSICSEESRDQKTLMIVSRDIDLENIEKSHVFNGTYFVLGGSVPILEKEPETKVRSRELEKRIATSVKKGLMEVILALNATPEGENTTDYIREFLKPFADKKIIRISTLGKGLSTGTELEYSDSETIKNAFKHRE
ncbi:toprim domain-containing protein [Candidatus Parcubacteria bacterium]|nr:toprim domain-containing protein [Candidatus Parcubacteria bacterium]